MPRSSLQKIVSGGQTGVDRAALDVAIYLGIEHGGWCPLGRRSEDGEIPADYRLQETRSRDYTVRTEQNVIDADGTLVLHRGKLSGGTKLTVALAKKHQRPHLCLDLADHDDAISTNSPESIDGFNSLDRLSDWIRDNNLSVLNIAGPRESTSPGIARQAEQFLVRAFGRGPAWSR